MLTRSLLLHSDILAAGVLLASSAESVENPSISKVIGKSIEVPFLTHRDGSMQYICHFSAQSMSGDIKLHIIHCFSLQYEGRHKDS